jgi:hypothetical protein
MGVEQSFRQKEEVSRKYGKGKTHIAVYNAERSGAYILQYCSLLLIIITTYAY